MHTLLGITLITLLYLPASAGVNVTAISPNTSPTAGAVNVTGSRSFLWSRPGTERVFAVFGSGFGTSGAIVSVRLA